jgi:hypothetical protein
VTLRTDDPIDPYPERITQALDCPAAPGAVGPLEGPGVDEFCGVVEPTVDLWETGEVIPSEEELALLAELTGYPVEFFYREPVKLTGGFFCVSSGPRHGCYDPDDPALLTAMALADVEERSVVARPRPKPSPAAPRRRAPRPRITAPASLPECSGCHDPMRRDTWTRQGGRCTTCGPASG